MGLNTLVARTFTDYVESFRVVGDWREHDDDDYKHGRVPDNTMMLQIAMRAALDKMKKLQAFAYVAGRLSPAQC
jgi:arabinogalactan endo-1,4-beta-galactosidase